MCSAAQSPSLSARFRHLCLAAILVGTANDATPLWVLPQNPYIVDFQGEPKLLRTSGEHDGSVINPAFVYITYLEVLERDRMNLTRVVLRNRLPFGFDDFPLSSTLTPRATRAPADSGPEEPGWEIAFAWAGAMSARPKPVA